MPKSPKYKLTPKPATTFGGGARVDASKKRSLRKSKLREKPDTDRVDNDVHDDVDIREDGAVSESSVNDDDNDHEVATTPLTSGSRQRTTALPTAATAATVVSTPAAAGHTVAPSTPVSSQTAVSTPTVAVHIGVPPTTPTVETTHTAVVPIQGTVLIPFKEDQLPTYDGTSSVEDWKRAILRSFRIHAVPDDQQVTITLNRLRGSADLCVRTLLPDQPGLEKIFEVLASQRNEHLLSTSTAYAQMHALRQGSSSYLQHMQSVFKVFGKLPDAIPTVDRARAFYNTLELKWQRVIDAKSVNPFVRPNVSIGEMDEVIRTYAFERTISLAAPYTTPTTTTTTTTVPTTSLYAECSTPQALAVFHPDRPKSNKRKRDDEHSTHHHNSKRARTSACNFCGNVGHWEKECRKKKAASAMAKQQSQQYRRTSTANATRAATTPGRPAGSSRHE
jgi:hypothetical protein